MKKLQIKQLRQINGGIQPGQCFYKDPVTGKMTRGCFVGDGEWIDGVWYEYASDIQNTCQSCFA